MNSKSLFPFGIEMINEEGDLDVTELKDLVLKNSLVVIRRCLEVTEEKLIQLGESLSETGRVLEWDFGKVLTMTYQPNAVNYLFSSESVPLHWDGAFHVEPQFLIFYCLETMGEGGETLFCQTEKIYRDLSKEMKTEIADLEIVYSTEKKAHYGGEVNVRTLSEHPIKKTAILKMAEEVKSIKNPVQVRPSNPKLYQYLMGKLYQPSYLYCHRWEKGDLLICDNLSLLHGRHSLRENTDRKFMRVQSL